MTLPNERYNSISHARQFLYDLLDPSKTPKVPLEIRKRARMVLKHFPGPFEMDRAASKTPDIFENYDNKRK